MHKNESVQYEKIAMKKCSLKRPQHDISAEWKIAMGECIMKTVQNEKSAREKSAT